MFRGMALLAATALVITGCGRPDQEFIEGTPDFDALAMEITGDASEGMGKMEPGQSREALVSSYLTGARNAVRGLNDMVRRILTPIAELINSEDPSVPQADLRVYGPVDRGEVTFKLTLKRITAVKYGFKLEAKVLGAEDSTYVTVLAGAMVKGALPHRGRGVLGIDLDAYKTVDPTFEGQGKLLTGFAHVGDNKALAYRLAAFTPNVTAHAPVTAVFAGYRKVSEGFTAIRLASWTNIADTATTDPELILTRLRHKATVGGRADIVAVQGDIAPDTMYWGTACWDTAEQETGYVLRQCTRGDYGASCVVVQGTVASLLNCAADVDQTPSGDGTDGTMEGGAPTGTEDLVPPETFPTIDG